MSRRVYLLGIGLALTALALVFTDWVLSLPAGVTEANARRIRPGMTPTEVKVLLGKPADEATIIRRPGSSGADFQWGSWVKTWNGKTATVTVWFGEDDNVIWVEVKRLPQQPSPLSSLRTWLGW